MVVIGMNTEKILRLCGLYTKALREKEQAIEYAKKEFLEITEPLEKFQNLLRKWNRTENGRIDMAYGLMREYSNKTVTKARLEMERKIRDAKLRFKQIEADIKEEIKKG